VVKTKAQLKFEQMKEEQQKKRILEKASKTHKQRVEEFNRHLDSLTEHFDIPKVSWTK
jgi:protein FAM32A